MSKTAKQFLGEIGTMKGDVETAIFKQLRARGSNMTIVNGTVVEVHEGATVRSIYVGGKSALHQPLETLVDILSSMESESGE